MKSRKGTMGGILVLLGVLGAVVLAAGVQAQSGQAGEQTAQASAGCHYDAKVPYRVGGKLAAKATLACYNEPVGKVVKAAARACLQQQTAQGWKTLKCVKKVKHHAGLVVAVATRSCPHGSNTAYRTSASFRLRSSSGFRGHSTDTSNTRFFTNTC